MTFSATLPNQVMHLTQSQSQSDGRYAGHFLSPFMSMEKLKTGGFEDIYTFLKKTHWIFFPWL